MFEVYWQHRYNPSNYGCSIADSPEEAKGLVQHIEARGPYLTKIVEV